MRTFALIVALCAALTPVLGTPARPLYPRVSNTPCTLYDCPQATLGDTGTLNNQRTEFGTLVCSYSDGTTCEYSPTAGTYEGKAGRGSCITTPPCANARRGMMREVVHEVSMGRRNGDELEDQFQPW